MRWEVSNMEHSLWELLHALVEGHEELPALRWRRGDELVTVTYGRLLRDIENGTRRAAAIAETRIGIWGASDYAWIIATYACLLAGKHVILFDNMMDKRDLSGLAAYADVEAFAADAELIAEAGELFPDTPAYSFDEFARPGQDQAEDAGPALPPAAPERDFIIFTSGTSASAKGVVISVDTLVRHLKLFKHALPGNELETYFTPVPFFHLFGLLMVFEVLNRHGVFCIGSGARQLRDDLWAYRAQNVTIVPSMIKFVLESCGFPPETRAVITGGSLCPRAYQEKLRQQGIAAYGMYGMSETFGIVGLSGVDGGDIQKYHIIDGVRVEISQDGEVRSTLPSHFSCYYKKEAETNEALRGDTVMTGDLGEFDSEGFLRILGRVGEMLVLRNGEKLNATDMEAELKALPGVREFGVFGYDGQPILAYTPEADFDEAALRETLTRFNRGRPLDRKLTLFWNYGSPLPRTSIGKLKRNQLAAEYQQRIRSGQ